MNPTTFVKGEKIGKNLNVLLCLYCCCSQKCLCGEAAAAALTLIRTVFLRNLIGTYVDNCQHAIFVCFSMLMRTVFKVYMLSSYSRYARLINLTTRSIDCTVNLILIKHCNLESKIQGLLPTEGIILACLALI